MTEARITDRQDGQRRGAGGVQLEELARLHEKTIVDERRLAALLRVTSRTVRRMVTRGELPPPVRLSGRSTWFSGRVLDYVERRIEEAERESERRARKISAMMP